MKKNRLIRFPGLLKRFRKNLMFIKCCIVFIFVFNVFVALQWLLY